MSTQIPAYCPSCGAVFASRLLLSGDVSNLTLQGNKESCPFCGGMADTAEGVFDIAKDIISVISAPRITHQMLSTFSVAVERAYAKKTPPEELIKTAEAIDPSLGKTIRKICEIKKPYYFAGLLIILLVIKSCNLNLNVTLDVNQLIDQLKSTSPTMITSPQREDEEGPSQQDINK